MVNAEHVGRMLHDFISRRFVSRTDLGKIIGVPNTAIYTYEKRSSTQTSNLLRISHALKYNFFADIAATLPDSYERGVYQTSPLDTLIAQQADEIKKLQWENQLMRELLSKK